MRRKRSLPVISVSSRDSEEAQALSDDEGNADLSMEILAKAGSRKFHNNRSQSSVASGTSSGGDLLNGMILVSDDERSRGSDVEISDKVFHADRQKGAELPAKPEDTPSTNVLLVASFTEVQQTGKIDGAEQSQKDGKTTKKKKTKKKVAGDAMGDSEKPERDILFKVIADDGEDNLAMRKLLRGPRYFDLPEEKTCYRCGNVGHLAADCTEEARKKACYVCGSLDHEQKDCPQGSCFICKGIGHFARSCPNKANQINKGHDSAKICLHCGVVGHEMNVCDRDYSPEDLKVIQCYMCKKFGHLCCADVVDTSDVQVSCYNCGELGHTGVGCAKRRTGNSDDKQPVKVCYKCGEEGHFARGCGKRDEGDLWPDPRTPHTRKSRKEEQFLSFKSVPAAVGAHSHWVDVQLQERRAHTPAISKWPERWNMASETDRWVSFQANGVANESPWFPETKFHHERYTQEHTGSDPRKRRRYSAHYVDEAKGQHTFFHEVELETPGSSRRNFKRRRYDGEVRQSDAGERRFW